jgi:tetratricopeptide (TPR) repeat protein
VPDGLLRPNEADGSRGQGKTTSGRRRGRRRGVEIRPGSVKQARQEAGLSLGQVARGDISRTAIYFVETGKAKPSRETLELIAERTGRPVDFFLELDPQRRAVVRITEVERRLVTGDPEGAIAAAEAALSAEPGPDSEARIKFLMSTAYLRIAQPVMGRRLAAAARAYFEQAGDLHMVADCLGNEASAAYLMQDPTALKIAEGALATVRALKPVPRPTESRLLGVLGHTLVAIHDWQAAINCYEQAIEAADVVQDLQKLSLMYSGLSLAYEELGQLEQAGRFAQKALTIHQTLNDRLSLARSENNLGMLLLRAGDISSAQAHIDRAIGIFEEANVETGKAQILLSLVEVALARRDVMTAKREAGQALALAERTHEAATVSDAHYWLARVAHEDGDEAAVDTEFAAALSEPYEQTSRERIATYRTAYAEILEGRGDIVEANRQLKAALAALGTRPAAADSTRSATA